MYYIKLKLWLVHAPHAKPKSDSIVLEFETKEEAEAFQKNVNYTTGIPFSCDIGSDKDGFTEHSISKWQYTTRIPLKPLRCLEPKHFSLLLFILITYESNIAKSNNFV